MEPNPLPLIGLLFGVWLPTLSAIGWTGQLFTTLIVWLEQGRPENIGVDGKTADRSNVVLVISPAEFFIGWRIVSAAAILTLVLEQLMRHEVRRFPPVMRVWEQVLSVFIIISTVVASFALASLPVPDAGSPMTIHQYLLFLFMFGVFPLISCSVSEYFLRHHPRTLWYVRGVKITVAILFIPLFVAFGVAMHEAKEGIVLEWAIAFGSSSCLISYFSDLVMWMLGRLDYHEKAFPS